MNSRAITHAQAEEILRFIEHEIYKLRHELRGSYHDKIMIMMPNWIKPLFSMYFRERFSYFQSQLIELKFYGIITQPNYTDEIVVFYEDYHLNPERFKPAVYAIKFEEGNNSLDG